MKSFLLVGLGGFVGATLRHLAVGWVERFHFFGYRPGSFPLGTLAVNVLGCFVIGVLGALAMRRQLLGSDGWLLVVVGCLGGFTTYSSFAFDTLLQGHSGDWDKAFLYVALHLVVGLAAVWLGFGLATRLSQLIG